MNSNCTMTRSREGKSGQKKALIDGDSWTSAFTGQVLLVSIPCGGCISRERRRMDILPVFGTKIRQKSGLSTGARQILS